MRIFLIIMVVSFSVNLLLLFAMIFIERKKPQSIMSWLLILTVLPIVGFILYIVLGSGLSITTRRMFKKRKIYAKDYLKYIDTKSYINESDYAELYKEHLELKSFNAAGGSVLFPYNKVKIFLNGPEKLDALEKDLLAAKRTINLEYYIFSGDSTGQRIMKILCDKAREGVKVKLIYDSLGCKKTHRTFFKQLKKAGGEIAEFFPPFFYIRNLNFKLNYRNHRKIVVIDGKIGYTGGINFRDDHMGKKRRLSPWRDTHIRIEGSGVYGLQNVFINDWRYCKRDNTPAEILVEEGYFPKIRARGNVSTQIIASGPDEKEAKIKDNFVKAILNAKKKVYIQTPYFIPDDVFTSALKIAAKSGVDIKIMLPLKPDRRIVQLASFSFAEDLVSSGIEFYLYNGFIHSKAIIIDDDILSIGTCNIDNRSFALNFEVQCNLYSAELAKEYEQEFYNDISNSVKVDEKYFKENHLITKLGQALFRLLAPIL